MLFRKQPFGFYLQKLKAVFVFTGLVILYQLFRNPPTENTSLKSKEVSPWVKQSRRLDSLLTVVASSTTPKLRSFHPNFLTDYRAYRLDLPTDVVDRIKAYHAAGKWITDRSVFQKVTGISDSSYERIAPYLKYPPSRSKSKPFVPAPIIKKDLNHATALELQITWNWPSIVGANCCLSRSDSSFFKHGTTSRGVWIIRRGKTTINPLF